MFIYITAAAWKGYLKTIRWETSRDCQYSSGTKLVWTRPQLTSLNTTQNTTTLVCSTPEEYLEYRNYNLRHWNTIWPLIIKRLGDPLLFRGDSAFKYSWDFRFLSFTSSVLFPNFRRVRMFSIRTFCLTVSKQTAANTDRLPGRMCVITFGGFRWVP